MLPVVGEFEIKFLFYSAVASPAMKIDGQPATMQ